MACAVPVLASAVGGLPEVVVDGETGFLTPPGDIDAMIAHGVRALRDGALHARLRDAAARRAGAIAHPRVVERPPGGPAAGSEGATDELPAPAQTRFRYLLATKEIHGFTH